MSISPNQKSQSNGFNLIQRFAEAQLMLCQPCKKYCKEDFTSSQGRAMQTEKINEIAQKQFRDCMTHCREVKRHDAML